LDEQRFLTLSCKVTKEVVSLDLCAADRAAMLLAGPGKHLTPHQFHDIITAAAKRTGTDVSLSSLSSTSGILETGEGTSPLDKGVNTSIASKSNSSLSNLVLIDVRNIYETEIGHFKCPDNVPVLDPKTRKVMNNE
jgi:predicted sulfurtransferase